MPRTSKEPSWIRNIRVHRILRYLKKKEKTMRNWKMRALWLLAALAILVLAGCQPTAGGPAAPVDPERAQSLNIAVGRRIADPTNLNIYAPGVSRSDTGLHQIVYEYFF